MLSSEPNKAYIESKTDATEYFGIYNDHHSTKSFELQISILN